MKNDLAGFGRKCPNCKQIKAEHLKMGGLSQNIDTPTWKWEDVNMNFVVGLPHIWKQNDYLDHCG